MPSWEMPNWVMIASSQGSVRIFKIFFLPCFIDQPLHMFPPAHVQALRNPGMDLPARFFTGLGMCLQEKPVILLVFENRLPTISPVHDLIDRPGYCS
jgi:hypothetical protein